MNILDTIAEKWALLCDKVGPVVTKIGTVFKKTGDFIALFIAYLVKFKKLFLAIPVAWAAVMLAINNLTKLPEKVGLDLQLDGSFTFEVSRELAAFGPVVLTLVCLVLMFCSKRVMTPWVVSLITLVVPIFIWVINVFPY